MTFTEIVSAVAGQLNLTSSEALTRIGIKVNMRYKQVCSDIGLTVAQRVADLQANTTQGVATVTFTPIEKIERVIDDHSGSLRVLQEVSIDELKRETPSASDTPTRYAIQSVSSGSVTIRLDVLPQAVFALKADGRETAETLSGSLEPQFPASFHDILVEGAIADETVKMEKGGLSERYEKKFSARLSKLRFDVTKSASLKTRQGGSLAASSASGSGGGSGAATGATSYTQTGLITFALPSAQAPFAVSTTDATHVPNLGAEFIGNVTSDRLIGRDTAGTGESEQLTVGGGVEFTGSGGIQTSALTGDVTKAGGGTALTIANDAVTYAKMQNVSAASKLLGRGDSGSGDVQEITLGTGLSMSGTTLSVPTFPLVCQGRLTLTTAVPVTTSDVTAAGTIYFAPYGGSRVALYDGSAWALYTFTERSLALTLTSAKNYDVFVYDNAGTLTLELSAAWTNDTTRADALTTQDGVLVKSGATTRRYLGTIRASGSNTTEDSASKRFVWNFYNRVVRPMRALDTTDTWSYTTATWRQARASAANLVEVVIGVAEVMVEVSVTGAAQNTNIQVPFAVGVGYDSTSSPLGHARGASNTHVAGTTLPVHAHARHTPAIGYHYYAWLEISGATGTTTWVGDGGDVYWQSGLVASTQG